MKNSILIFALICAQLSALGQSCQDVTFNYVTYSTTEIDGQCWFSDNLQTVSTANGQAIPWTTSLSTFSSATGPMMYAPSQSYASQGLGYFYNGYAANMTDLCPSGFHVATDSDWKKLENFLGMPDNELDSTGYRGESELVGYKLKSVDGWEYFGTPEDGGSDEFQFNVKGSGFVTDALNKPGAMSLFWANTPSGYGLRNFYVFNDGVSRSVSASANMGLKIRCVECQYDTDGDGVCDSSEIPGCTSPTACNYSSSATDDDGSCDFCSCHVETCPGDFNGDGIIGSADYLIFANNYGYGYNEYDLNCDGSVNTPDFHIFLSIYGTTCN